jgi:hypothetical protein
MDPLVQYRDSTDMLVKCICCWLSASVEATPITWLDVSPHGYSDAR